MRLALETPRHRHDARPACSCQWCLSARYQTNLIANGDFESGATGFITDYGNTGIGGGSQQYSISTNPENDHPVQPGNTFGYGDHTTGAVNMLALNGAVADDQLV